MSKQKLDSTGFTLVELMIATAVFAVVLVTLSTAIVQISRMFFKGVTASNTQEVARSILNDVSQSIQFDSVNYLPGKDNSTDNLIHAACIGNTQYSFKLGVQQGTGAGNSPHALVRATQPACVDSEAQYLAGGSVKGQEMLSNKMRLAKFDIQQLSDPDLWRITVRVVYGDDDLLCDSAQPATCSDPDTMVIPNTSANLRCKSIRDGTQFCAVSELSTIVEKRIY